MQAIRLSVFALIVPALTSPVVHARVSGDPFGAYCIVQKVVTGQDDGQRSTIQIWPTCSVRPTASSSRPGFRNGLGVETNMLFAWHWRGIP
jgi:hypothetical protein